MTPFFETDHCRLFLADCLPAMREMPDKAFDLAIVDPPYGIEKQIFVGGGSHTKSLVKFHQMYSENHKKWDKPVPDEYFSELFRISVHQIIWGGNYYRLGFTRGFIVWDKPEMRIHTMSDCEFAWTSFDCPAKIKKISRATRGISIHPTQKPVALYRWLLTNYAKPGDTILDTHLGSGSIAIACHDLGFHLTAFEIDEEYLSAAVKRIERYLQQPKLFTAKPAQPQQETMF